MMVASKPAALILAVFGFLAAPLAIANQEVIESLSRTVAAKTARLGDKAIACEQLKKDRSAFNIDVDALTEFKLSRHDTIAAIAYLGLRNDYRCDHEERVQLAYSLGVLDASKRDYGIADATIRKIQAELIYPSTRYLEMEVDYRRLSPPVRHYFEDAFGTQPFDSISVINALPAFPAR